MKTMPLTKTNPYLKDSALRDRLNAQAVRSSCGVEGIKSAKSNNPVQLKRRRKKLYQDLRDRLACS